MHPSISYILRAVLDWINDEGHTPYIVASVDKMGTQIPPGVAKENQVTLNVGTDAVRELEINDEILAFSARFSGVARQVVLPLNAIRMIYARETQAGLLIKDGVLMELLPPSLNKESVIEKEDRKNPTKPKLKLVE